MLSRYVGVAALAYGALAGAAFLLSGVADEGLPWAMEPWLPWGRGPRLATSALLGVGIALVVVRLTRTLVRRARWARELHVSLRGVLGPLTTRQIAFFALISGVAEELFFRGALLPTTGLWISSAVFGLLHVGPSRRFLPWTAWAVVMGVVFGVLFAATGELVGCVVAHVVINYENMHFLEAHDPTARPPGRTTPVDPSVVGRRRHRSGGLMQPPGRL